MKHRATIEQRASDWQADTTRTHSQPASIVTPAQHSTTTVAVRSLGNLDHSLTHSPGHCGRVLDHFPSNSSIHRPDHLAPSSASSHGYVIVVVIGTTGSATLIPPRGALSRSLSVFQSQRYSTNLQRFVCRVLRDATATRQGDRVDAAAYRCR